MTVETILKSFDCLPWLTEEVFDELNFFVSCIEYLFYGFMLECHSVNKWQNVVKQRVVIGTEDNK